MHHSETDPDYLPATAPTDGYIDVLGVAPADGTGFCRPLDYHHPEAQILRLTREQARHLIHALTFSLDRSE